MNRQVATGALVCLTLGTLQLPVLAEPWFNKYDGNHDGKWTYNDFVRAHHDWYKRHPEERAITDKELRDQWRAFDKEHHGWVREEQVRNFHHWD